jgi:hypothetical protein
VAAGIHSADQQDSAPTLGFAANRPRSRLPSGFGGSYSLKSVLPALVPEMSYAGLEVADGQAAGLAWESLVCGGLDEDERDRIREALLDYCGQDTLAMVKLVEKLRICSRRNNTEFVAPSRVRLGQLRP